MVSVKGFFKTSAKTLWTGKKKFLQIIWMLSVWQNLFPIQGLSNLIFNNNNNNLSNKTKLNDQKINDKR